MLCCVTCYCFTTAIHLELLFAADLQVEDAVEGDVRFLWNTKHLTIEQNVFETEHNADSRAEGVNQL